MPLFIALGSLLVSGLFAASTVLDKADDLTDQPSSNNLSMLNMAGFVLILIAAYMVYQKVK